MRPFENATSSTLTPLQPLNTSSRRFEEHQTRRTAEHTTGRRWSVAGEEGTTVIGSSGPRRVEGRRSVRATELERLGAFLARQGAGPSIALIVGEAGVGKSHLLRLLGHIANDRGWRVLTGRSLEASRFVPYRVLQGLLRPLTRMGLSPDTAGALRSAFMSQDAAAERPERHLAVVEATLALFEQEIENGPLLIALDDFHHADVDTLQVLATVGEVLSDRPLRLALAARIHPPEMASTRYQTLLHWSQEGLAEMVHLDPLNQEQVGALLEELLRIPPHPTLLRSIFASSSGVPAAVVGVVEQLRSAGALGDLDGTAYLAAPVSPLTLPAHNPCIQRLGVFDDPTKETLRALSIFARFSLGYVPTLAQMVQRDTRAVGTILDHLVEGGILAVAESRALRYRVPAVGATVANSLNPVEHQRLHGDIARDLLSRSTPSLPDERSELAIHLVEADDQLVREHLGLLEEIGLECSRANPVLAVRCFETIAAHVPLRDPRHQRALTLSLQGLYQQSLHERVIERADQVLRFPSVQADPRTRAVVVATLVRSYRSVGRVQAAAELVAKELGGRPTPTPLLLAEQGLTSIYARQLDAAREQLISALETAGADRGAALIAQNALVTLAVTEGRIEEAFEALAFGRSSLRDLRSHAQSSSLATEAVFRFIAGQLREGSSALERADAFSGLQRPDSLEMALAVGWAYRSYLEGDWERLVALAREAFATFPPDVGIFSVSVIAALTARVLVLQGKFRRARWWLDQLSSDYRFGAELADAERARLALGLGDLKGATEIAHAAIEAAERDGVRLWRDDLLDVAASIALERKDRSEAQRLAELARQQARVTGTLSSRLTADLLTAEVDGDIDAAGRAIELAASEGLVLVEARARLVAGTLGSDSEENLRQAHRQLGLIDATSLRSKAVAEMRRRKISVPRARAPRPKDLTEIESNLISLVAEGLSNKQLAASLFMSEKTVEAHLSRIFEKTGLNSRVELATAWISGSLQSQVSARDEAAATGTLGR
jgi:DNA-binding NarL/FixJ family response regulator